MSDVVIAEQQKIADTFKRLGLIPTAINVSDAVRKPSS
jgi:sulfonate transport system substrate-binding protein